MGPDPATRQEIHSTPVLLCNALVFLTVYATVNPHLFRLRLWLLPLALASTWNMSTKFAFGDPWLNTFNFGIGGVGFTMFMKLWELATLEEPPKYDQQPTCTKQSVVCKDCMVNTISYMADIRCLHWNNDSPCHIPEDTRSDVSHRQFYTDTLFRLLKNLFFLDTLHVVFGNIGNIATPQGDTIYRTSFALTKNIHINLPHPLLGALPLAFMVGLVIMSSMSAGHYLVTLLAAPLTWLPPSISPHSLPASSLKKEWPPLFDQPLEATSLRDFWSNRWHAVFRRNFWVSGGKPGLWLGGRIGGLLGKVVDIFVPVRGESSREEQLRSIGMRMGGVMGVFLMSGLLHDFGMWCMAQGVDLRRVTGYFLLQGVGLAVENALGLGQVDKNKTKAATQDAGGAVANGVGGKVHGEESAGSRPTSRLYHRFMKLWTLMWVVLPVPMMIDAWLQRGLAGVVIVPHSLSPARVLMKMWNDFAYGS
ncbi:hypothetical protein BDV93DRAFT_545840 [Ceratobasidium sp. AG-I]|nr:hypothetical protein BDV93DRAFT_545840 [Ceratobasidium sp. AG-I]